MLFLITLSEKLVHVGYSIWLYVKTDNNEAYRTVPGCVKLSIFPQHWPCFSSMPSLYHSTTMSGSPTGTKRHSKCAGSFSINRVNGFIGVLNLGGRGLSLWNMSSGGSSPILAYDGAVGADGALSGGSLCKPAWEKLTNHDCRKNFSGNEHVRKQMAKTNSQIKIIKPK